jgi:methylglutaconyl-CoA hydratase
MGWIASVRIDSCGMKSMSAAEFVSLTVDNRRVASVTLNRPDAKNALSNELMCELREAVGEIRHDASIRAVILSNAGDVFCAGGDLKGMNRQKQNSREGRIADAMEFAATLRELNELPQLVIGRINGSAFGGGVGLISLCDIAIGQRSAMFRLTEVTLGLIAATISPYVVAKVGVPNSRRMMLNAFPMDGIAARGLGLLDVVVDSIAELDAAVEHEVVRVLKCAPDAVANTKKLIRFVSTHELDVSIDYTVKALADAWESEEINEGIDAFFNKRKPKWVTS